MNITKHIAVTIAFTFAQIAVAQMQQTAEVAIITKHDVATTSTKIKVGIWIKIVPEMHIYWSNTGGDTGIPTSVTWQLPDGVKAGDVRWSNPALFKNADGSTAIGYEGEVLGLVEFEGSTELLPAVKGTVRWLACRDESCMPGRATVELKMESAAQPEVFIKFADKFPTETLPQDVKISIADGNIAVQASELTEALFLPYKASTPAVGPVKTIDGKATLETKTADGILQLTRNGKTTAYKMGI